MKFDENIRKILFNVAFVDVVKGQRREEQYVSDAYKSTVRLYSQPMQLPALRVYRNRFGKYDNLLPHEVPTYLDFITQVMLDHESELGKVFKKDFDDETQ